MNSVNRLIVADSLPESSGGWISRAILKCWVRRIQASIRAMRSLAPCTIVTTSTELLGMKATDVETVEFKAPDQLAHKYKNEADFSKLHRFADAVFKESERSIYDAWFVHGDIPLLKIIEPRWTNPLFNQVLWRLDYHADRLRTGSIPSHVIVFGSGPVASAEKKLFRLAGIKHVLEDPVTNVLLQLRKSLICLRLSFQRHAVAHGNQWMRESEKIDLSSWGREGNARRILFVGTIDRTVARLREVAPMLIENGYEVYLVVNGRVTITEELRQVGVKVAFLGDFYSDLAGKPWNTTNQTIPFSVVQQLVRSIQRGAHQYQGIELGEMACDFIYEAICEFRNAAQNSIEIADNVLNRVRPHLIVTFEESEFPRAVTFLAKCRKIRSVVILLLSPNWFSGLIRREQDEMWVSGEVLRKSFQPWVEGRQIAVIGDPLVDRILGRKRTFDKAKFWAKYDVSVTRGIFGILATYPDYSSVCLEDVETLFRSGSMYAARLNKTLVVKCHPLQEIKQVKRWMRRWQCEGVVIANCDLIDFSMGCEVVFVPATTAVWQPMLAGTPIISFQASPVDLDLSLYGMGYGAKKGVVQLSGDTPQFEIVAALARPESPQREEQIARGFQHVTEHVGPLDESAGKRFLAQLEFSSSLATNVSNVNRGPA